MFIKSITKILVALSIFSSPHAAAQDKPIKLESAVQLLRVAEEGEPQLEEARNVVPGDTLLFTTRFRNQGSAVVEDFVIVNPVPGDLVLTEEPTMDGTVSVDGGKTWGRLGELTITDTTGEQRPASLQDITHLRWEFQEIPSGEAGQVRFSAMVR